MRTLLLIAATLVGAVLGMAQQDAGALVSNDFDKDTAGWIVLGANGSLAVTHAAAQVKNGSGALAFTYEMGGKPFSAAVLPMTGGMAGMQQIQFWAKSDHDTAVGLVLSEKKPGGADYSAWFWAPANVWQHIQFTPADFVANDGPNDPVDPDGKLDLDEVQGAGLFDLSYLFGAIPENADFPMVIARPAGTHTLLLDDFQVLRAGAKRRGGRSMNIDSFERGFLEWATLGGMNLKVAEPGNPLGLPAMEVSYEDAAGVHPVLIRRVSNLDLSKARQLAFDLASQRESTLVVSVELKTAGAGTGPRYDAIIYPPAGRRVFHVSLNLEDFDKDPNVPGPVNIDPAQIKTLTLTDITAATGGAPGKNTIWIGKMEALER